MMYWKDVVHRIESVGLPFKRWDDEKHPPTGKVRGEKIVAESVTERGDYHTFVYVTKRGTIGVRLRERCGTKVFHSVEPALEHLREHNVGVKNT